MKKLFAQLMILVSVMPKIQAFEKKSKFSIHVLFDALANLQVTNAEIDEEMGKSVDKVEKLNADICNMQSLKERNERIQSNLENLLNVSV